MAEAGTYRVLANTFAFRFEKYGRRTVSRGEEIDLTAEEAQALLSGPVMVVGPKPGSTPKAAAA